MKARMNRAATAVIMAVIVVCAVGDVAADIPRMISYQGLVRDSLGNPINGTGIMFRFGLHDDSTGGSILWAESATLDVTDGLINHNLGSSVPLPDTLFTKFEELWLQITIDAEMIVPRTRLVSTGYSFRVSTVDSASGGTILGDVKILTSSGGNGFQVTQSGFGRAGYLQISNPGNPEAALLGITNGSGPAGYFFQENGLTALEAQTAGFDDFGAAVYGTITSSAPASFAAAVKGENLSTTDNGVGVWGIHNGDGRGVYGVSESSYGVDGSSNTGTGVRGISHSTSSNAIAVHGLMNSTSPGSFSAAVRGENRGTSFNGIGVWGSQGGSGWGVYGSADGVLARGIYGKSDNGIGLYGQTSSGHSGYFTGGRVAVVNASDASVSGSASGYLVLGDAGAENIVLDNNEIIARDNGTSSVLHLQAEGGPVAIGAQGITPPSGYILVVDGKAILEEVEVQLSNAWPDYVFEDDYKLTPLAELERTIKENKHLPGIPSANQMEQDKRVAIGEMQTKLLEKVEELTLYVINMNKEIDQLRAEKTRLEERLIELETEKL